MFKRELIKLKKIIVISRKISDIFGAIKSIKNNKLGKKSSISNSMLLSNMNKNMFEGKYEV